MVGITKTARTYDIGTIGVTDHYSITKRGLRVIIADGLLL